MSGTGDLNLLQTVQCWNVRTVFGDIEAVLFGMIHAKFWSEYNQYVSKFKQGQNCLKSLCGTN